MLCTSDQAQHPPSTPASRRQAGRASGEHSAARPLVCPSPRPVGALSQPSPASPAPSPPAAVMNLPVTPKGEVRGLPTGLRETVSFFPASAHPLTQHCLTGVCRGWLSRGGHD